MRLSRFYTQTITYWEPGTPDGYGGTTYPEPVTIKGRWEGRKELFIDAEGNEVRSQSVVYPDQLVELGGYLYEGESTASDPTTVDGALEIRAVRRVPSVKGTQEVIKVWL